MQWGGVVALLAIIVDKAHSLAVISMKRKNVGDPAIVIKDFESRISRIETTSESTKQRCEILECKMDTALSNIALLLERTKS
jgi:hypothetical protein